MIKKIAITRARSESSYGAGICQTAHRRKKAPVLALEPLSVEWPVDRSVPSSARSFGAKIGDEFNERNEKVDSLSASLDGSKGKVASLERDISALQGEIRSRDGELQQARELARPQLLTLLQAGIEMDLLFRTDEHVLSDSTGMKLQQLASSLAANPEIQIRLDGFADERGNEEYNRELSVKRAEHVRDVLVNAGIPAARIDVSAHGESPAIEQNADSFALERRVSLTLYMGDTPSFAATPR